jgi:hypothetical protein
MLRSTPARVAALIQDLPSRVIVEMAQPVRPTRAWVFAELKGHFEFVYQTKTQPNHAEFLLDWSKPVAGSSLIRAVFVAARHELDLPTLSSSVVQFQVLAHAKFL